MIDILINTSKIKYAILDELFKKIKIDDKAVNLYIDLHTVISKMYRNSTNSDIINYNEDNVKLMVVSILNFIAHYRRYLFNRLKKSNRIYIVFNKKIPNYQASLIPYGQVFFDRYSSKNKDYAAINTIMDAAIPYIKEMCQYFEWIYFIENEGIEDMVAMQYLIDKNDGFNIVFSNHEICYQLVKNNKTIILYPKRDDSVLITQSNLIKFILKDMKYEAKHVNYKLYPMILMINGVKSRDIPPINIRGITKLIKMIDMMIYKELISNDVSARSFINYIMQLSPSSEEGEDLLIKRFQAISAPNGVKALTQSQIKSIESSIVDLYDQRGLEKLNDALEYEMGIDIQELNKNKIPDRVIW